MKDSLKIHILFPFNTQPSGGGNQFLKALRNFFKTANLYVDEPQDADIILFNSHQLINEILSLKRKYPKKYFLHRVDGPTFLIRGKNKQLDRFIFCVNQDVADGTIFQSEWSKNECLAAGLKKTPVETTILNAPDSNFFNTKGKQGFNVKNKTRLIATSWSSNWKKGFKVYKWLDENLDFAKYEMVFVGNSPIKFKNIIHIPPLPSDKLAEQLKKSDIYITASEVDPCSNSLIEALHCGMPSIVYCDGGHPEIIGKAGKCFKKAEEIPSLLSDAVEHYEDLRTAIKLKNIDAVARTYLDFFYCVKKSNNLSPPKTVNWVTYIKLYVLMYYSRFTLRMSNIRSRFGGV